MNILDTLILESINDYINDVITDNAIDESILLEISKKEKRDKKNVKRLKKDIYNAIVHNKKSSKETLKKLPKDLSKYKKDDSEVDEKPKKETKKEKKIRDIYKKGKKLTNGRRGDFNAKMDRETNPNLNAQDNEDLANLVDSPYINLAAVAHDVYPGHTPEGAQSQLRKKVKGLKNDNGSTYKLKKKEAIRLRRALAKEL